MSRFAALLFALATIASLGADDAKKDEAPPLKLTAEETALIDQTNAERKKADLNPLAPNAKLMDAARKHAANMAKQNKLEHVLDENTPADRVKAAGYKYRRVGENVAWNAPNAKEALGVWMDSKPHRDNILHTDYTEIGVAVAKNEKGEPYWVQVFAKP